MALTVGSRLGHYDGTALIGEGRDARIVEWAGVEMSRYMSILLTIGVAAVGTVLLVWMIQRRLIYFPLGDVPAPSQVGLTLVEEVQFPTADGLTHNGWFIRSASSAPASTVVVFNGNAGNRAYRAPLATALQDQGVQVFLFDYRGYGGNEGTPTETGLRADARAAHTYVVGRG